MFGLIGHLTSLAHAQSVARDLGYEEYADQGLDFWCMAPPQIVDDITVKSITGQIIQGKYVESCFLPEMLSPSRIKSATRKIVNAMVHAQKNGIDITALGGFSSIIFERFNLSKIRQVRNIELEIRRFTTGNTHTAYIICRQVEQASQKHGIDLSNATVTICGATGDIGSAVCRWLNVRTDVKDLIFVARNQDNLKELQANLGRGKILPIEEALPLSDVVVWVASMPKGMQIDTTSLKQPCVLIDGGYPKNMSTLVQEPDVHVINGGIVEHSLDIDWKIMQIVAMSAPARQLFACFAESMLLEFEGWHTNFSWGRNQITVENMDKIGEVSVKHGFKPLIA
ncbi:acyl-ACP reductase [Thalassoporum mexicanum PCC 7367]|uniref:long-chain acyl-[acyl-carrier-protein] reductase n=1 Tax=Thalassoporum mexicanum TaxID=3457544 RepID=UPI00029F9F97|nr:long-chain acyl-[acyl-carrier-protein] reductase [Pseudanabaena sp. PCC 7367]AFY71860.1 acyl-ACP reductase [Pseudanabaena sp. PCC 7367]